MKNPCSNAFFSSEAYFNQKDLFYLSSIKLGLKGLNSNFINLNLNPAYLKVEGLLGLKVKLVGFYRNQPLTLTLNLSRWREDYG